MNKIRLSSFNTNKTAPGLGKIWSDVEFVLTEGHQVNVYAPSGSTLPLPIAIISMEEAIERINEEITDLTSFKEKCEFRLNKEHQ